MKTVLLQDFRIFKIRILLKFWILFLNPYRFQDPEVLEGCKEYESDLHLVNFPYMSGNISSAPSYSFYVL